MYYKGIKIWISAVVLAATLSFGSAEADEWKGTDKALFGALVGLQVVDILQTYEVKKHPERWSEMNPIYGDPPNMGVVIGVKALYTGLVWYLLDQHTASADRGGALWVLNAIAASVVIHNHHVGVRIEF